VSEPKQNTDLEKKTPCNWEK